MHEPSEAELVREIAEAIHEFVRRYPNHYAARALASIVSRRRAGEEVSRAEDDLVLATLVHAIKGQPPEPFRRR